jgi:hypothetical protein
MKLAWAIYAELEEKMPIIDCPMSKIYPIFADGPLRGCQVELPENCLYSGYRVWEMPDPKITDWLEPLPASPLVSFNETFYYLHKIILFKHLIIIGSEKYRAEDIDTETILHLLLSPSAKKGLWK